MRSIWLLTLLALGLGSGARAQTQDDFFDDTVLQEVRITINSRDWETLKAHFDEDTYYPADIRWRNITMRNAGIRSRGRATRNSIKPSLRVDLNRYLSNQELLGLKAFDLKNMYSDPSGLRESVAMKVYSGVGIAAPREAHARLYVNNEYAGIYVIVEAIDRTFITNRFGDAEGQVETGGYLFEYNWISPWYFEYLGTDLRAYAVLFEPKTRDTDSIVNLYAPIEELIRRINESSDDDFVAQVGAYLDLPELMTYAAVETFTDEWDGLTATWGINNFYLYRLEQTGLSVLFPWDRDAAFGPMDDPIASRQDLNLLVRRALGIPSLRQTYVAALMACVSLAQQTVPGDPRGWLEREVDRQVRQIEVAVSEDARFPWTLDDFHAYVNQMLEFARQRPPFVVCELAWQQNGNTGPSSCSNTPQSPRKKFAHAGGGR